jgi:hypothetical protein
VDERTRVPGGIDDLLRRTIQHFVVVRFHANAGTFVRETRQRNLPLNDSTQIKRKALKVRVVWQGVKSGIAEISENSGAIREPGFSRHLRKCPVRNELNNVDSSAEVAEQLRGDPFSRLVE